MIGINLNILDSKKILKNFFYQILADSINVPDTLILNNLKKICQKYSLTLSLHLPYSFNLIKESHVPKLIKWMEAADYIGYVKYCVLHVGKAGSLTQKEAERMFITNLLKIPNTFQSELLIENPAGQGTELFTNFKSFLKIPEQTPFNICLDTCHIFASGNIENISQASSLLKLSKKYIKLFHLNDSEAEFNSRVDRHSPLFSGKISEELLEYYINYISKHNIDTILETDGIEAVKKYFNHRIGDKKVSFQSPITNLNNHITTPLRQQAYSETNQYKKNALLTAVSIISQVPFKITTSNYTQLISYKGIGTGIIERIEEILINYPNTSTPKKIKRYFPIHRSLISNLAKKYIIVGSYRRNKSYINDIDIIVVSEAQYNSLIKDLKITKVLSQGPKKTSLEVNIKNHIIQVDILKVYNPQQFPFSLLYFTGSREFNINMRKIAKQQGYKLNEYGLFKGNYRVPNLKTENDIFKFLGLEYLPPFKRT